MLLSSSCDCDCDCFVTAVAVEDEDVGFWGDVCDNPVCDADVEDEPASSLVIDEDEGDEEDDERNVEEDEDVEDEDSMMTDTCEPEREDWDRGGGGAVNEKRGTKEGSVESTSLSGLAVL